MSSPNIVTPEAEAAIEKLEAITSGPEHAEMLELIDELESLGLHTVEDADFLELQKDIHGRIQALLESELVEGTMITEPRIQEKLEKLLVLFVEAIEKSEAAEDEEDEEDEAEVDTQDIASPEEEVNAEDELADDEDYQADKAELERIETERATEAGEAGTESGEIATREEFETLMRGVLRKPTEFNLDESQITNRSLRAVMSKMRENNLIPGEDGFDNAKFRQFETELHSSDKVAGPVIRAIKLRHTNIRTSDQMELEIAAQGTRVNEMETAARAAEKSLDNQFKIIVAKKGKETVEDKLEHEKLKLKSETKNKVLAYHKKRLAELKQIQPYITEVKLSPKQVLLKLTKLTEEEGADFSEIAEASSLAVGEQIRARQNLTRTEQLAQIFKPSLKNTLAELVKAKELKGLESEKLSELAKLSNNYDGLRDWVKELGEKGPKQVAAIMAYLQLSISEGNINRFSETATIRLLAGLRQVRDDIVHQKIIDEMPDAKPQVQFDARLKEISKWDEESIQVNRNIIEQLIKDSKYSMAGKAAAVGAVGVAGATLLGPSAIALLKTPAILSAISSMGWGTASALTGAGILGAGKAAEKGVKTFTPEKEQQATAIYNHVIKRVAGACVLAPFGIYALAGLAAPEAMKLLGFGFKNRESLKKGATTGGKGVAAVGRGTGTVLSYIGKGIVAPFKWASRRRSK